MDLSFANAELAALCNSEGRLAERWGQEAGRMVARRLLELAAADADTIDRLPQVQMRTEKNTGQTIIDFDGGKVVFRSEIGEDSRRTASPSHMLIIGLDVRGSTTS